MNKISFLIALGIVVVAIVWYVVAPPREQTGEQTVISSFEECAAAGNAVMESYPRQCRTQDGKHFVENVEPIFPPLPGGLPPVPGSHDGTLCIQVITPARNIITGEIRSFPTPCDVPPGWISIMYETPGQFVE